MLSIQHVLSTPRQANVRAATTRGKVMGIQMTALVRRRSVTVAAAAVLTTLAVVAAMRRGVLEAQDRSPVSPDLYRDLRWRCTGPFDGGPVASVVGVAGEAGVYTITT